MREHVPYRSSLMVLSILLIAGCSSIPNIFKPAKYSLLSSTKNFIAMNNIRSNGTIVDKSDFYPKRAFAFSYRYCARNPVEAKQDILEYQLLAKNVCDNNKGQLIHQENGTWCVSSVNSAEERPLFYARISSTELWAELCPDGPFVTLKVIENTYASAGKWYNAALVLGYQPYYQYRKIISINTVDGQLYQMPKEPVVNELWTEESQFIYTSIGQVVCLFEQLEGPALGYTYRGTVDSVSNDKVKVLVTTKLRGDLRTAPISEPLEWHKEAYITAPANAWFVCG
ncbi:hypothetical protein [Photobacterium lipolyticum]|uniref:Uncharacterized protein n=1 Tax=Photobacterium lipolyticum TaxID=266810 RepID=A0A2T3MYK4_9GAMM|nr:hypothetical protein [Photobacterium lipolyticum]PSW05076.1 hypothetical protein C9I89_09780 [Photobacterium lipolyticum]